MAGTEDLTSSEVNPYEKYRHVAFTLDEFLNMVKAHKEYFINYCEIIVTENGLIFLASPSHGSVAEWLKKKGFINCVSVWYNDWTLENCGVKNFKRLTASQLRILNSLISHGLMSYYGFYRRY